ncbi:NADP-dependent malic enzyme [Persicobacter psychrovividus]|uniref:NADP-dependent malic enzyme n=1 Tax=Persicobacter psychrovividus TaxID=387638 RepID=A0ABN6L9L9_9BACT|nr:NADP-dependent malic enzyme [Persicobacter psychrovividus]
MSDKLKRDALAYHQQGTPGKIEVVPTKPVSTQLDLALAYSPGVAEPCLEIAKDKSNSFKYTAKGNLVGVISNGTAVLGLGNIGAEASKPVMEGKGVLFKKFAGIDVFDIEIDEEDPDKFIQIVKAMEPTFGGVNLEDIKAPESFKIEQTLIKEMNIPVMHDDQHGTAIISSAALLNAMEIVGKKIEEMKFVVNGAGASAIACTKLYVSLGAKKENILMLDSKGVIKNDRENLDESKAMFATDRRDVSTLEEAIKGADMFLGLSRANVLSSEAVKSMAENPIVFALANPDPEIPYEEAMASRKDIIMATGRSDHPNQVNNVLGFPYIFRGALDVQATTINEEMKLAAVRALAEMTKESVPEMVKQAYGEQAISFGREYLIPKPLDPRLISRISPAVAKAAIDSGVARTHIDDWDAYRVELEERIGIHQSLIRDVIATAKSQPKRIVMIDGESSKMIQAAFSIMDEAIGTPILLGNEELIRSRIAALQLEMPEVEIINPMRRNDEREEFGAQLWETRKRKGMTLKQCVKSMRDRSNYAAMMVENGQADVVLGGVTQDYPNALLPSLQVIGKRADVNRVAGMNIVTANNNPYFFADTTVNVNPSAEELAGIIELTAERVRSFNIEPRIAVLSYSNFGSAKGEVPAKVQQAVEIVKGNQPELVVEGDIQANVAVNSELQQEVYPFSALAEKGANTFVFPDLASGNIAYKLLMELGGAESVGPILLGMNKPVQILQLGASVREIVQLAAIGVVEAQNN